MNRSSPLQRSSVDPSNPFHCYTGMGIVLREIGFPATRTMLIEVRAYV